MAFQHALSTNRYGEADLIVSSSAANGTHLTLATAMADAVSGQTIFLRDSVTENVTITPGVNIAAWSGGTLNTPTIIGTLTMTAAGTSTIYGIRLQTNSAAVISVTGSAATILNVDNCYLNATNNTAISFTSANTSAAINLSNCRGDLGTTGIAVHTMTSTGTLSYNRCIFTNTGASTTASSNSAGAVFYRYSIFTSPLSTSSGGVLVNDYSAVDTSTQNVTSVTTAGTGNSSSLYGYYASGSASAVSIGTGTIFNSVNDFNNSSNTNAVTGLGTWGLGSMGYIGTSSGNNVTAITIRSLQAGQYIGRAINTAPAATTLGQRIESTGTSVAMVSTTAKTIASISLTPGIWDVSCLATAVPTGGAFVATSFAVNISTTDNTVVGTLGIETFQLSISPSTMTVMSGAVPSYRVSLSATTTYYLVCNVTFTSTTCPTSGRISATRCA